MKAMPLLLALLIALSPGAFADTAADQRAIGQMMQLTWAKPDAPLQVGPVTVEGDHAVAGWTQGERGGRALLQRQGDTWRVVLCAGDALLEPNTLRDAGVPSAQVGPLSQAVSAAEREVPASRVKQFASFKGMMRVEADAAHQHSASKP